MLVRRSVREPVGALAVIAPSPAEATRTIREKAFLVPHLAST
ncbi:hypothetical protein [Streptomyces sp. NBC_00691]|nr:hypothetical protein [Streptomyces sp. NBC_00691]